MPWSHSEAMQGWEAAEERESHARCEAEKWQELATTIAGCAECLLDLMTEDLRKYAVPEVKDAIAFLEVAVARVRARERPRAGRTDGDVPGPSKPGVVPPSGPVSDEVQQAMGARQN